MMKVFDGGWFRSSSPRSCSSDVLAAGPRGAAARARAGHYSLSNFIPQVRTKTPCPAPPSTDQPLDVVPVPLLHNLKHNKVLHVRMVLLHVATGLPRVAPERRVGPFSATISTLSGALRLHGHPNIPQVLDDCRSQKLDFNMMETSFFVGRVTIVAAGTRASGLQAAGVRLHAPQRAAGDGVLPHPAGPGHRTRRTGGDVARARRNRRR